MRDGLHQTAYGGPDLTSENATRSGAKLDNGVAPQGHHQWSVGLLLVLPQWTTPNIARPYRFFHEDARGPG